MDLAGKNVLVTGGAQRVGRAISLAFANEGANVLIHYFASSAEAARTVDDIRMLGVKAYLFQADLRDSQQIRQMCDQILQIEGGVEVIVNNASIFKLTPFPSQDDQGWEEVLSVLIDAPYRLINQLSPAMLEKGEGAIINILDLSIWEAWHNFTAHSVGKSGLLALTRQLALELAPHVRVNAVAPGYILPPEHYSAERIKKIAENIPLKRWGKVEELAEAVLFLAKADFITGATLTLDGGSSLTSQQG